ncbi:MAG: GatB/YqeY domain-containing protein [Gammaproteobacteria bacterium]|nr:MAG: GatB/YqeY domain-containing protein [Gammaproteobacteria bacterium]
MNDQSLAQSIRADMKTAMKARDKERLSTIRLILAEFKRIEVDERIEVDDARALAVLDKMVKQRRDSAEQYTSAGRDELAATENAEIAVIQQYLPAQLSEEELIAIVDAAIAASDATGMAAMGPVMGQLKPQLQGRADIGAVSQLVKSRLAG